MSWLCTANLYLHVNVKGIKNESDQVFIVLRKGLRQVTFFAANPEPVSVDLFKEPRNRFPAWRACTTTLFVVPARQATQDVGVDSSESNPGLHKNVYTNTGSGLRIYSKLP